MGVLVGTAAGDALGAGYEFEPPIADSTPVLMAGGGCLKWAPGEWTDDTSMAIALAEALVLTVERCGDGIDLPSLDELVKRWADWAKDARDAGIQTRAVLKDAERGASVCGNLGAHQAQDASQALHEQTGKTAGNGSLMRTSPLALAYLHRNDAELATAACDVSALTHYDRTAGEACALWCIAIRHAVLTGKIDIRIGLPSLSTEAALYWKSKIEDAEAKKPHDFRRNGWVVEAFQAAWSAIATTSSTNDANHLEVALEASVRGGWDTDTVAAIAGGLLGAGYGLSAIPNAWREILHGWPEIMCADLKSITLAIVGVNPSVD
ncbi:MAG: ADP-ribosylglycohydrolase family protein [Thermomicrobiales bacterium]